MTQMPPTPSSSSSNEQTVIFGADQHLVGTATLPARPQPAWGRTMLLLTNSGVIPRIGPHRFNVNLARHCAGMGLATLRFDLSGLGDSRRSNSRLSADEQFVLDTRAAMDLARDRFGCDRFVMLGICSGGDVAQLAAINDARLQALVLFDSYVYPTRRARLLGILHRLERLGPTGALAKFTAWAARRRSPPEPVEQAETADRPAAPARLEESGIFGRSSVPTIEQFGARMRALADRGVVMLFVYSGGEPRWFNYEAQFRDMFAPHGFVDRVSYAWQQRSDHTLTQPHAQRALIERVDAWLREHVAVSAPAPHDSRSPDDTAARP